MASSTSATSGATATAGAEPGRAGLTRPGATGRRVFVALPIAEATGEALGAWAKTTITGSSLRLVPPASYHVTLVFCGFVDESRIGELVGIVAQSTPPRLAWRLEPDAVRVLGGVVALTCRHDGADAVQQALAERLAAAGLARPQRRAWLAHITLARSRATRAALRGSLPAPPLVITGDRVVVYESRLSRSGARYEPLASLPTAEAS